MIDREFSYASRAPAHRIDYKGLRLNLEDAEIGLAGPFQHENAAIAVAAVEGLRGQGLEIPEDAIRRGLKEVVWPGRFDIVSHSPTVILDCAHNELAVEALLEALDAELGRDLKPKLLFGCLEDKQWGRMAEMLAGRVRSAVLTRVKPKRPLEPELLAPIFASRVPTQIVREPLEAVAALMAQTSASDVVLVTGSVYLVGEVYPWFLARTGRRGLFPEASV
jgi:dihydrofolate synthase/folylpolyglutamate synthase